MSGVGFLRGLGQKRGVDQKLFELIVSKRGHVCRLRFTTMFIALNLIQIKSNVVHGPMPRYVRPRRYSVGKPAKARFPHANHRVILVDRSETGALVLFDSLSVDQVASLPAEFELVMPDGAQQVVKAVRRDGRAIGVRFVEEH